MKKNDFIQLTRLSDLSPKKIKAKKPALHKKLNVTASNSAKIKLEKTLKKASPEIRTAFKSIDFKPTTIGVTSFSTLISAKLDMNAISDKTKKKITSEIESLKPLGGIEAVLQPDLPISMNPAFYSDLEKGKLFRLTDIAGISEAKVNKALNLNIEAKDLSENRLKELVKKKVLTKKEAQNLGLSSNLHSLFDEHLDLTEHVAKVKKPKSLQDLVGVDRAGWKKIIKDAKVKLAKDVTADDYAELLFKKLETLYPNIALKQQKKTLPQSAITKHLNTTKKLFRKNKSVYGPQSFRRLNTESLSSSDQKKMNAAFDELNGVINSYHGFGLEKIANDISKTPAKRAKEITSAINIHDKFLENNKEVNLLSIDFKHDSKDVSKLDFTGLSKKEKVQVMDTAKTYQRVYAITEDVEATTQMIATGYPSAFHITSGTFNEFMTNSKFDYTTATNYFDRAYQMIVRSSGIMGSVLDVMTGSFGWMNVGNIGPSIKDYLRDIPGYDDLFGSMAFCDCEHCSSIYSPAAYFVDLMQFVQQYVTDKHFTGDKENHVLNLKVRRPDLWSLPLTCENTSTLVPYLDIINEILEAYIAKKKGFAGDLSDRPALEVFVYKNEIALEKPGNWKSRVNSFSQPFHLPMSSVETYLKHFELTRNDFAKMFGLSEPLQAQAYFNLSDKAYELIVKKESGISFLRKVYDINFTVASNKIKAFDAQLLVKNIPVSRAELDQLLSSKFINPTGSIKIVGGKISSDSVQNDIERINNLTTDSLDKMHRFVRLWKRTDWTIPEFELVIQTLFAVGVTNKIDEKAVNVLSRFIQLKELLSLKVEEMCAVWGDIPNIELEEDSETLLNTLFNHADDVDLNGTYPKPGVNFVHSALVLDNSTAPAEFTSARLMSGLELSDADVLVLIQNLATPLGIADIDSATESERGFLLSIKNLSLLYRHSKVAQQLGIGIQELFQLAQLLPELPNNYIEELAHIDSVVQFHAWSDQNNWTLDDLHFIIESGNVMDNSAYPEVDVIVENVLNGIRSSEALIFADTVFAYFDDVTEAQSKALIAANSNVIQLAADGTNFQLKSDFDPSNAIVVPAGITRAEVELRDVLNLYHPSYLIPFQLASNLDISETNVNKLIIALGIDLDDDTFADELADEALAPTSIKNAVEKILPLNLMFRDTKFDSDVLDFIIANPTLFTINDFDTLDLEDVIKLTSLLDFLVKLDDGTMNVDVLSETLLGFTVPQQYATVDQSKLANVLSTEESILSTLHGNIPNQNDAISSLNALKDFADLSSSLGVGALDMQKLTSNEYDVLAEGVNVVLAAFRTKYKTVEERAEKLEAYQDSLRSQKRSALSTYLIRSGFPEFKDENDLFHYFLIDTELEGCARTSRLVAATMSLQLYLHRILLNLEQDSKDPGTAGRVNLMVNPDDPNDEDYEVFPLDEWDWRKNYRVWEANRKVFLYPENYIEPDLRDNKSPLFEELENELLQDDVNEDTVLAAYGKYMRGFDDLGHLKIAGSFHQKDEDTKTDVLHLFGVSSSDPIRYYYRTVENIYYAETDTSSKGTVWNPWNEIKVQIPVRKVAPIIYNGRLFLFWLRVTTLAKTIFDDNRSIFTGYDHKFEIEFTTLNLDQTWSPVQKLSAKDMYPFSGNGVIHDPLAENAERQAFLDALMVNFPFFNFNNLTDEIIDLRTPRYDTEPHHGPVDEYTLDDFMWNQIFPTVDCNNRLILSGAGYQMRSTLDFYNLSLHQAGVRSVDGRESITLTTPEQSKIFNKNGDDLYKGTSPSSLYFDQYAHNALITNVPKSDDIMNRHWSENVIDQSYPSTYISGNRIARLRTGTEVQVVNGAYADAVLDVSGDLLYMKGSALAGDTFFLSRLGTTLSETLTRTLFTSGVDHMLSIETQKALKEENAPITLVNSFVTNKTVTDKIDYTGPYGVYYREIFFHIPFLLANHLNSQGKYEEAQKWYHYIFNPTSNEHIDLSAPGLSVEEKKKLELDRNWQYLEFRNLDIESLRTQLEDTTAIEAYKKDPFNPHAIARLRLSAYQKSIVMKYIDNLLDWGDQLFSLDTMESVNEATLLYIVAKEILGDKPAQLGDCGEGKVIPKTYEKILPHLGQGTEFLTEIENYIFVPSPNKPKFTKDSFTVGRHAIALANNKAITNIKAKSRRVKPVAAIASDLTLDKLIVTDGDIIKPTKLGIEYGVPSITTKAPEDAFTGKFSRGTNMTLKWAKPNPYVNRPWLVPSFSISFLKQISPVFCIPGNKDLLGYFDRVGDRLFKIRNCMNIDGQVRQLALFAPEIDPRVLVRGKAAGLSLDEILSSIAGNLPPYRFEYILEKAKAFTSVVQSFGSSLLGAMGKRDAEELNMLRMTQQVNILELSNKTREFEIESAINNVSRAQDKIASLQYEIGHYDSLISTDLIAWEWAQRISTHATSVLHGGAGLLDTLAGISHLIPELGSPFSLKYGGKQLGNSADSWSGVMKDFAAVTSNVAKSMGMEAGYERRREGWKHKRDGLEFQLTQAEIGLTMAEISRDVLIEKQTIHNQQIQNMDEMIEFYGDKFTNLGLFTWLSSSMQQLYKEAYNNAMAIARLAEQAYKFERDDSNIYISSSNFDSSKAGLLAGDKLLLSLQMMEKKYLETNYRSHEIDQAFSITQINPNALIELKQTGECNFEIPELFFDMFYPGHYKRKIKAVRLSIPSVTGPYVNVSASLSLDSSFIRMNPKLGAAELMEIPKSRTTSIATSTAQNDAGVFQLNFRDERYMPFEGAGTISSWKLSLPKNFRQFDYNTINDVIIHVSYTAEYDGLLKDKVEEQNAAVEGTIANTLKNNSLHRVFSMRQEFSNDFHRLINSPVDQDLALSIESKHFQIFYNGRTIKIQNSKMLLVVPEGQTIAGVKLKVNGDTIEGFTQDANMSLVFEKDLGNSLGNNLLTDHTVSVEASGDLAPPAAGGITPAFDREKIQDILVVVEYTVE